MSGFYEVLFDPTVGSGSEGGANWSTDIVQAETPNESRNKNWEHALWEWNLKTGIRTREQWEYAFHFHMGVAQGRTNGFRWQAYDFNTATDLIHPDKPLLGIGNGVKTAFQIKKPFGIDPYIYQMPINKPVASTVKIYIDEAEIASDHAIYAWSVDTTTGVVTFESASSIDDKEIYCDYQFHFPVRFDTDYVGSTWVNFQKYRFDIPICGLKPVDYCP